MSMKQSLLSAALIAGLGVAALMPQPASAVDGTINISGKVIAQTCTVNTNNGATVVLPPVNKSVFTAAGSTAGDTNFTIALSNCDSLLTNAQMSFSGANIDTSNGKLKNTSSGGSNIEIELVNGATPINLSNNTNAPSVPLNSGSGSTTLKARYYASTTPVTAGAVSTSVDFTLTYQ